MWTSSGVTIFLAKKLLSSFVAYVHMCLSWWVVFSLVVCCAATTEDSGFLAKKIVTHIGQNM
jgi:hypothetical protein